MTPSIYLFFKGDCLEAMTRYAEALGGEIRAKEIFRNGDVPDPQSRMPGDDDLVLNMVLRLGDAMIFASDNPDEMYQTPAGFRVTVEAASRLEFDRMFEMLGDDARAVEMAPDETFWAERFAMFTDRYGTPWMLSFTGAKAA